MDIRVEPISSPQRCRLNLTTNPPYIFEDKKQLEGFTRMIKAITTTNCKQCLKTSPNYLIARPVLFINDV